MAHLESARLAWRDRRLFDDLAAYAMFIGYPRSGHTLVGSLLNAHASVVVAHELDVFRFVASGFTRRQLFALILQRDRWFAEKGRTWSDYDYTIPGQWQGRFTSLVIIGDKKGSASAYRLRRRPDLLERLRSTVRLPLRVVHIMRNPFDNIATMARHDRKGIEHSVERYFSRVESVAVTRRALGPDELIDVRIESFISDPAAGLAGLCAFLGVAAPDDYLAACTAVVFDSPRRTRADAPWTDGLIQQVAERAAAHDFLTGYRFDD